MERDLVFGRSLNIGATLTAEAQEQFAIKTALADLYRDYIACLNKQDWTKLGQFVHDDVHHNAQRIGILGYRKMLEKDFYEIPDLHFQHSAADF